MRFVSLAAALALASGCAPVPDQGLRLRSVLQRDTAGLVLHADGFTGHAGMFGSNCPFETEEGRVTGDYDLPGEGEVVVDHGPSPLGPATVLLVLDRRLWLLEKSSGEYVIGELGSSGAVDARLTEAGAAVVMRRDGACSLGWRGWEAPEGRVPLSACPTAMDADPVTGATALVIDGSLAIATPDGVTAMEVPAAAVAWSAAAGGFVVGDALGGLSAWSLDRELLWEAQAAGAVEALAAPAEVGRVVAHAAAAEGQGQLLWLDAASGAALAERETPSVARAVTVSDDASTIAVTVRDRSYFFEAAPELR